MSEMTASPTLAFAAAEIRKYLRAAGLREADLPPVRVQCSGCGRDDAYSFEAPPAAVTVTGSNARSALIGAYAYLKEIGFRFFAPGEDFTRIPRLTDPRQLCVPRKASRAGHTIRGVCVEGAVSLEQLLSYIDWLPKAGMNTCFLQFFRPDVFFERWYAHENNPLIPPEELSEADKEAFDAALVRGIRKRGLMLHRAGHGWTSQALGYPGNGWQRQREPTEERLRNRIALLHGQRRLFGGIPANTNLCYTSEDVQQALTDAVVAYAKAHPEADAVHFWLADTFNNLCECETCRASTLSDQYVRILNRIDAALTAAGLATRIVFLLYQELLCPPREARISHPERFILMFAPISRSFETSYPRELPSGSCPTFPRNAMTLPLSIEENLRYYAAWRQVFPGDAFIFDYHLGRAHYGDPGYMKIARTLYRDAERLRELGFQGMIACQELRVALPNALPIYLMGRALWGDGAGPDTIGDDYFSALYGEAAPRVRKYFEAVSGLCDTDYANANGPRTRPDLTPRYREIARLSREEEAALSPGSDPILLRYQSTLRQNAAYGDALAALTRGDREAADTAFADFCRLVRRRESAYPGDYDVYRAIEVAQRYTGLHEPPEKINQEKEMNAHESESH